MSAVMLEMAATFNLLYPKVLSLPLSVGKSTVGLGLTRTEVSTPVCVVGP